MNSQTAKKILALYRPGTADAEDAYFSEARQLCERDPGLKRWFDEHCAQYAALRSRFRQVPVPEGLKEQILAERKVHTTPLWRRPSIVLAAAAAAMAVLTGLVWSLWLSPREAAEDLTYTGFRNRMVSIALRGYEMESLTHDPEQVRAFLARNRAPSDYAIRAPLQKATLVGCATENWQGAKVSMICFASNKLLPPAQTDLWLFVVDRTAVSNPPASEVPLLAKVNRATTATWTHGDKTYILVADGDETFLRQYL